MVKLGYPSKDPVSVSDDTSAPVAPQVSIAQYARLGARASAAELLDGLESLNSLNTRKVTHAPKAPSRPCRSRIACSCRHTCRRACRRLWRRTQLRCASHSRYLRRLAIALLIPCYAGAEREKVTNNKGQAPCLPLVPLHQPSPERTTPVVATRAPLPLPFPLKVACLTARRIVG